MTLRGRAGEVWDLSWPGGGAVLVLLGQASEDRPGHVLMRALTRASDDASVPAGVEDWWVDTWFGPQTGRPA